MVKASMKLVSNIFSHVPPFFTELARSLAGEIDCGEQTLLTHSTDGGAYQIRPQAIVYPKNVGDIKSVIIFAREYGMPVTVCGGQSASSGGALSEGIIINMSRHFNKIRHVNMMEHTVTVDAGVTLLELSERLREWNMEVPMLPVGDTDGTIGGLLSTKSATSSSFLHGTIREWVESVTLVVDTGEEHHIQDGTTPSGRLLAIYQTVFPLLTEHGPILRASKPDNADDASGYSVWGTSIGPRQLLDQLVGSEGTLGIITSVTIRVSPRKPYSITLALSIPSRELLMTCIDVARHHFVENIFMYDETFTDLAYRTSPNLMLGDETSPYHLLVTLRDSDERRLQTKNASFIKALPLQKESIEESNRKTQAMCEQSSYLQKILRLYTQGANVAIPLATGIIATHHEYPILLKEIQDYLDEQGKVYTISGYAGSGHISVTALFDPKSLLYENDIMTYTHDIYMLVKKHHGGISATGGDGIAKTPYLPLFYSDQAMQIFKKIKNAWDPLLVFNPSKKLSITTDILHKHLRKTQD